MNHAKGGVKRDTGRVAIRRTPFHSSQIAELFQKVGFYVRNSTARSTVLIGANPDVLAVRFASDRCRGTIAEIYRFRSVKETISAIEMNFRNG